MNILRTLKKIKTIFDWKQYPDDFKEKWYAYIDREFARRHEGYWFTNKGKATYITGTHYMYLQWSKIDVGQADFREANRLFYIFWEACKADTTMLRNVLPQKQTVWFFIHGIWRNCQPCHYL